MVQGRLVNESWMDESGEKRSSGKIEATAVRGLLGRPSRAAAQPAAAQPAAAQPAAAAPEEDVDMPF